MKQSLWEGAPRCLRFRSGRFGVTGAGAEAMGLGLRLLLCVASHVSPCACAWIGVMPCGACFFVQVLVQVRLKAEPGTRKVVPHISSTARMCDCAEARQMAHHNSVAHRDPALPLVPERTSLHASARIQNCPRCQTNIPSVLQAKHKQTVSTTRFH